MVGDAAACKERADERVGAPVAFPSRQTARAFAGESSRSRPGGGRRLVARPGRRRRGRARSVRAGSRCTLGPRDGPTEGLADLAGGAAGESCDRGVAGAGSEAAGGTRPGEAARTLAAPVPALPPQLSGAGSAGGPSDGRAVGGREGAGAGTPRRPVGPGRRHGQQPRLDVGRLGVAHGARRVLGGSAWDTLAAEAKKNGTG